MLNELDIVVAKRQLDLNVPKGSVGTVLMVYDDKAYEIEFMENDETLAVLTVEKDDVELMQASD